MILLIALLIVGCALPLAMPSPRAMGLCVAAALALFVIVLVHPGPERDRSVIVTVGIVTAGMLIGAVLRALVFQGVLNEDRQIRKRLPRELPERFR